MSIVSLPPFPFFKFCLPFGAIEICLNLGEQTAGQRIYHIIRNSLVIWRTLVF